MGEIAEMMLDGSMDPETGEFNFDGEDGPGWPMTAAEAAEYQRHTRGGDRRRFRRDPDAPREEPVYRLTKLWRKKLEAFGDVRNYDAWHWQVRLRGVLVADWWPHKSKWRIDGVIGHGPVQAFRDALEKKARS